LLKLKLKTVRLKHIVLPIAALGILGSYAVYDGHQKSKFNSELWKAAADQDAEKTRHGMVYPLMAHVLKVGMSMEEAKALLGSPAEERTGGDCSGIGAPRVELFYAVDGENGSFEHLVLGFSHKLKLIDFYITGETMPLIY